MRCRLILLISEHPIQQGIRKGGVRHFCDGRGRGRGRTGTDRMAYSRKWDGQTLAQIGQWLNCLSSELVSCESLVLVIGGCGGE